MAQTCVRAPYRCGLSLLVSNHSLLVTNYWPAMLLLQGSVTDLSWL
jgi:hypothetical protein